jgi:predicted small secreted protein
LLTTSQEKEASMRLKLILPALVAATALALTGCVNNGGGGNTTTAS